jgi:hypothetical protein
MPFPDPHVDVDLAAPFPLPGGHSITGAEILAACDDLGATDDELAAAGRAWWTLCYASAVIPGFAAPTFADVLRRTIEFSRRIIQ